MAAAAISLAAFLVSPAPVAAATTVTVNDDTSGIGPPLATCAAPTYQGADKIQLAIDSAAPGDTILVCAGTYDSGSNAPNSAAAAIDKPLTIRGAQAGIDARFRSNTVPSSDESAIDDAQGGFVLNAGADGVTIDGFTVRDVWDQHPSPGFPSGIVSLGTVGGDTYVNNVLADNQSGIYLGSDPAKGPNLVQHNLFDSNNNTGAINGNGIYGDFGTNHATIDANRFFDNFNSAMVINCSPAPAGNCPAPAGTANSDLTITNNDADHQILLAGMSSSLVQGNSIHSLANGISLFGQNTGVTVSGNRITSVGSGFSGVRVASRFGFSANRSLSISGNTILGRGAEAGVRISAGGYTGGTLPVHFNRIFGNQTGLLSEDAAIPIDAENNWFGCNAGPGAPGCDTVSGAGSGATDFTPWLVLRVAASPAAIQPGGSSTVTGALDTNSAGSTPAANAFPSGTQIVFGTDLGSIASPRLSIGPSALSTLAAGSQTGVAGVSAALDGQLVSTPVSIQPAAMGEAAFSIVKVIRKKKKGTAKLVVQVPGGGQLHLSSRKAKSSGASPAVAGRYKLKLKPKHKARAKLLRSGKAKVKVTVTFTPTRGAVQTLSRRITLRKK